MTHAEALPIVILAWRRVHGREPNRREVLFTMAIASFETGYGRTGQHAELAASGRFNWGNIEIPRRADGTCPAGWAEGVDVGPVCFQVFASDLDAAEAFIRHLTTRHWPTIEAMAIGDARDVALAMRRAPAYYAGASGTGESARVDAYALGIRVHLAAIAKGLASSKGWTLGLVALLVLAGLGGWYTFYRWRA